MASALRSLARTTAPRATTMLPASSSISVRAMHATRASRLPYKDSQDRESLKPRVAEHTQSGRDDDVAEASDAAFNPDKTRPESESKQAMAGMGEGGAEASPLEGSGANQELQKPQGDEKTMKKGGAGQEISKGGASRGSSPPKGSDPKRV